MTDADASTPSRSKTVMLVRLGVVQIAFRPARPEWLADPFSTLGQDSVFVSVPPRLSAKVRDLGKRVRAAYVQQTRKKVVAILRQAIEWGVKVLVFPESVSLPKRYTNVAMRVVRYSASVGEIN